MSRLAAVVEHNTITAVTLLWAGYVVSFPAGHASILGDMYVAVSVFPTVVTAHLLGMKGARVVAVVFYPLHALLFLGSHHEIGLDLLGGPEGALGMLVLPLIALYAGYTSDLRRELIETDGVKDRFIAAVAHDVKNPLTGVLGLAIALRDEPGLPSDARELAAMVADKAQSAADIVEDLNVNALRNSGQFQIHPEPFDLGGEIWAACRGHSRGQPRGGRRRRGVRRSPPSTADPQRPFDQCAQARPTTGRCLRGRGSTVGDGRGDRSRGWPPAPRRRCAVRALRLGGNLRARRLDRFGTVVGPGPRPHGRRPDLPPVV